ncbi:midnolin homolog isoform X2 [Adelges cooleyi]|uniref:midnolin homolog isoform X2 n=1 Tax=Adelges cooleyi TaxID=133065 RepID=UPI00217F59B3|nr:midnolin homolog isoform X2 [Adelges cooleyi]
MEGSDAGDSKSGCGCSATAASVNNNNDGTAVGATAAAAAAAAAQQQQQQQHSAVHHHRAAEDPLAVPSMDDASEITITVSPTTGGQFDLSVLKTDSVESLKKVISKRLRVPKERICLLYRERQLRDGSLDDNQLMQGSRLTLLPSVETGLLVQRPEQSVMQALESLNDSQVNDFLSGKAPLNLTMRLGDHMMLIQLQLSTVSSSGTSKRPHPGAPTVATGTAALNAASTVAPEPPQATATAAAACSAGNIIGTPRLIPGVDAYPITRVRNVSDDSDDNSMDTAEETSTSTAPTPTPPITLAPATPTSAATGETPSSSPSTISAPAPCSCDGKTSVGTSTSTAAGDKPQLDTRALAEASRNLTQTLKQLSSEVLTTKSGSKEMHIGFKRRPGAIIESMQHHGKGVYSGTFSGTLNPALQDRFGRPKRDISTIIHILNDLLCATPQYRAAARSGTPAVCTATTLPPTAAAQAATAFSSASAMSAQPSTAADHAENDSKENAATRGKMERLRLIMEEKRERRRAGRSVPYDKTKAGTQWSAKSETQSVGPQDPTVDPTLPPEQVVV